MNSCTLYICTFLFFCLFVLSQTVFRKLKEMYDDGLSTVLNVNFIQSVSRLLGATQSNSILQTIIL